MIVKNNIAIDNGPLTKIPKAKTNHIIEGYRYLFCNKEPFFNIKFN